MIRIVTASVLLLTCVALADDDAMRNKLAGSWHADAANSKEASMLVFQPLTEGLHFTGSNGDKVMVEFVCKIGDECAIKDSGHHAKVTMYFNGPKLVETETIGSRVIRRRFGVTGDGNTMELEVIPIEPEGKTETLVFKRVQTETAKQ